MLTVRHTSTTEQRTKPRDLLSRINKGAREPFVLVREELDFGLELREPCFFALSAFECGLSVAFEEVAAFLFFCEVGFRFARGG